MASSLEVRKETPERFIDRWVTVQRLLTGTSSLTSSGDSGVNTPGA